MIGIRDLIVIAGEQLLDAESLLQAQRYDGAAYLSGYSLEIALKHKICATLNWTGFPFTRNEFEKYKSLKTHDLSVLLSFTGVETALKAAYLTEWSDFDNWNPEARYNPIGIINPADAIRMVSSAKILIGIL